jgi:hypothetical protein
MKKEFSSNRLVESITPSEPIKVKEYLSQWQHQNYPAQNSEDFTILVNDHMEVLRIPSSEALYPYNSYIIMKRKTWREIVKKLSYSQKERHSGHFRLNLEEILLNNILQKYARKRKEEGNPQLSDLFMNFLRIASRPGVNPFGKARREKKSQFQMVKLGLEILSIFLNEASEGDQLEVKQRAHEIRQNPPHFRQTRGLCMVGTLAIFLTEGLILGFIQVLQSFL